MVNIPQLSLVEALKEIPENPIQDLDSLSELLRDLDYPYVYNVLEAVCGIRAPSQIGSLRVRVIGYTLI